MNRFVFAPLLAALVGACSVPAPIAGYAGSYEETFSGKLVAHFDGRGIYTVDFTMDGSANYCSGSGKDGETPPPGALRAGTVNLSCSDGRTVLLKNEGTHITGGKMQGQDSQGRRFFLYYDMDSAMISSELGKFRQEAKGKNAAPMAPAMAPSRPAAAPSPSPSPFPDRPLALRYTAGPPRPDDVAVIIGNADYGRQGKDIPDVVPAYADAESVRLFALQALGIREGNIIFLKDATGTQMAGVFGSERNHRGQLHDWVKPGRSRVFVYFSGHGAPGGDGNAFLIPADADAARIEINGFPLAVLYANLAKLPAESVTLVLESCFSGASPAGAVIANASPVYLKAKEQEVPAQLTVIAAGGPTQMASWEKDKSNGLFTKAYLQAMSGEADRRPFGNGDGSVSLVELESYLKDTLTYTARRLYGRDQQAQISGGRR